jgi:hypothetical protein
MITYYQQSIQADDHRAELLREAEAKRLSRSAGQPALTDRLLVSVGDWMVTEGTRLKRRQKLPMTGSGFRIGSAEG